MRPRDDIATAGTLQRRNHVFARFDSTRRTRTAITMRDNPIGMTLCGMATGIAAASVTWPKLMN